jgi:hypothetical protein
VAASVSDDDAELQFVEHSSTPSSGMGEIVAIEGAVRFLAGLAGRGSVKSEDAGIVKMGFRVVLAASVGEDVVELASDGVADDVDASEGDVCSISPIDRENDIIDTVEKHFDCGYSVCRVSDWNGRTVDTEYIKC